MFRKSTSIIVFVCLLALSNYALAGQYQWWGTGAANNWHDGANWSAGVVPTVGDRACIEAKAPMPWIVATGGPAPDACCQSLEINPWMWETGPPDCNFTINSGHFDCNVVRLGGSSMQYANPGWSDTPAVLYMNGGLLTIHDEVAAYADEDNPPGPAGGRGLWIGGGSNSWWLNWGNVIVNGGEIRTPKIAIYNGDLTINGGLVYDTNSSPVEFTIRDMWDRNKIYINGGTLGIDGNQMAVLYSLVRARRIIPHNTRGEFNGSSYTEPAVYNATDTNTTLTATFKPGCAWQPSPEKYMTRVHCINGVTLTWKRGDWIGSPGGNNAHYVFLGTNFNDVNTAGVGTAGTASTVYKGTVLDPVDPNTDPCLLVANFVPLKVYYWRVDEVNDANTNYKGMVWQFTTITDQALDPMPVSAGTGLKVPLQLSWTAGDWSPTVHRVYFGTDSGAVTGAGTTDTTGMYRGPVNSPVYPLSKLREDRPGTPAGPDWTLAPDTIYYWRIDENAYNGINKQGATWSFDTGSQILIDDFQSYFYTEELNDVWQVGLPVCSGAAGNGRITMVREGARLSTRYMQFGYEAQGGAARYFSEVAHDYSDANFTGGPVLSSPPKLLEIGYRGTAINSNDPVYDRMYVALKDIGGDINIVLNPDPDAQQNGNWTTWAISFGDLGSGQAGQADLNHIDYLYLGFGYRCADDYYGGGDGNVMFDNISLRSSTCVEAEGPVADFDGNCIVNERDLDILAGAWLDADQDYDWIGTQEEPNAPILWYKFNEAAGTTVSDSGTGVDSNDYAGSIVNYIPLNWDTDGGRSPAAGGCIYLPDGQQCYVTAHVGSLYFHNPAEANFNDQISFSVWINADLTANEYRIQWPGLFGVWNADSSLETVELHCPSNLPDGPATPTGPCNWYKRGQQAGAPPPNDGYMIQAFRPLGDYGGRWNHWAFIKKPTEMLTYCNGNLVADGNSNDDVDVSGPLLTHPVGAFRIGTRGTNWAMWKGRLDDFQVYDYALSENEIHYLATDGTGLLHVEVASEANIKRSEPDIINFGDLAMMVDEWLTTKLWP